MLPLKISAHLIFPVAVFVLALPTFPVQGERISADSDSVNYYLNYWS